MTVFVALLRAVNVGGTGKLAMAELTELCAQIGFDKVRTYIQSGNVVFENRLAEKTVKSKLEAALSEHMGKPADVMVRTAAELRDILDANPFPRAEPAKVAVVFLSALVAKGALDDIAAPGGEQLKPAGREIYIHYPDGMGRSKLKLPSSIGAATARNINTVGKLVAMAES